jgi:hypothetical protein
MLVRKNMEINEHERLFKLYTQTKFKVKEQLIVGKDMEVNEHERLLPTLHTYKNRRNRTGGD